MPTLAAAKRCRSSSAATCSPPCPDSASTSRFRPRAGDRRVSRSTGAAGRIALARSTLTMRSTRQATRPCSCHAAAGARLRGTRHLTSSARATSVGVDAGLLDDRRPLVDLGLEVAAQALRASPCPCVTTLLPRSAMRLTNSGSAMPACSAAVRAVDDRLRRALRRVDAVPDARRRTPAVRLRSPAAAPSAIRHAACWSPRTP